MGKGGQNVEVATNLPNLETKIRKITVDELSKHRTPNDGNAPLLSLPFLL